MTHKILLIPQDNIKPYTIGIASSSNWSWTLAREQGATWQEDVYSLRNHDMEIARLTWINGRLAIDRGRSMSGYTIKVGNETLSQPTQSKYLPSGSVILFHSSGVIEVLTKGVLAQWLGSDSSDIAQLYKGVDQYPGISSAISIWEMQHSAGSFAREWASYIGQAVYDKLVLVTGKQHSHEKARMIAPPVNVQLGQVWEMSGTSTEGLGKTTHALQVIEVGIYADVTKLEDVGLGAKVKLEDGAEKVFPDFAFNYARLRS